MERERGDTRQRQTDRHTDRQTDRQTDELVACEPYLLREEGMRIVCSMYWIPTPYPLPSHHMVTTMAYVITTYVYTQPTPRLRPLNAPELLSSGRGGWQQQRRERDVRTHAGAILVIIVIIIAMV